MHTYISSLGQWINIFIMYQPLSMFVIRHSSTATVPETCCFVTFRWQRRERVWFLVMYGAPTGIECFATIVFAYTGRWVDNSLNLARGINGSSTLVVYCLHSQYTRDSALKHKQNIYGEREVSSNLQQQPFCTKTNQRCEPCHRQAHKRRPAARFLDDAVR